MNNAHQQGAEAGQVTPNAVHPGKYLCYLNGIRVPILGASIRSGVGIIPTADITMFPSKWLHRIGAGDRLEVQLFVLDNFHESGSPKYILMFDGTITNWGYTSTPHGRSLMLGATMDIAMYHQVRLEFLTTDQGVGQSLATEGSAPNTIPQYTNLPSLRLIQSGVDTPSADGTINLIYRPYDFLWNTVKELCGNHRPLSDYSIPVVNFFARFARRRNFVNRFVAYPTFDKVVDDPADVNGLPFPLLKAIQSQEILGTLYEQISTNLGQGASMLDVLLRTLSTFYYELVMVSSPRACEVNYETGEILTEPGQPKSRKRLMNYFVKPQSIFALPPRFNVLFPSMIEDISYQEHYSTQPTRVYAYDQYAGVAAQADQGLTRELFTAAYPPEAEGAMKARAGFRQSTLTPAQLSDITTGKNILVPGEEFFRGPVPSHMETPYVLGLLRTLQEREPAKAAEDPDYLARVARLYAEYEYFRQRYEQRAGMATIKFNPYVLPNYPCFIFDHRGSGFDQVGYVTEVTHTFSKGSMTTSVMYGYGRTLVETLEEMKAGSDVVALEMAPREVLDTVRWQTQSKENADLDYAKIQGGASKNYTAVTISDFLAYKNDAGEDEEIKLGDVSVTEAAYPQSSFGASSNGRPSEAQSRQIKATSNIDSTRDLYVKESVREQFYSHDAAMKYVSRDICTMYQYLQFLYGSDANIPQEIQQTEVLDPSGARYYNTLFTRVVSSAVSDVVATAEQAAASGATTPAAQEAGPLESAPATTVKVYQVPYNTTADDWTSRLESYRTEIEVSDLLIE